MHGGGQLPPDRQFHTATGLRPEFTDWSFLLPERCGQAAMMREIAIGMLVALFPRGSPESPREGRVAHRPRSQCSARMVRSYIPIPGVK